MDDEPLVRLITKATLEQFGYRTLLAIDDIEAVSLYANRHAGIAAVLTDMTMPIMDGTATIQVLRKINPSVRVIAASGLAISGAAARACGLKAEQFITKPYTADAPLKVVREVLASGS